MNKKRLREIYIATGILVGFVLIMVLLAQIS